MHVTYQVYTFINIINLSIQIYPYKTELDLPRVRLNSRFNSCLARLMLFISVPFRPFFDRLNGQPFNSCLPPKQNTLPPFTVYWPFNPFRRTLVRGHLRHGDQGRRLRRLHRQDQRAPTAHRCLLHPRAEELHHQLGTAG